MGKRIRNMIPLMATIALVLSMIGNGLSVLAAEMEAYEKSAGQTEMAKYESEGNGIFARAYAESGIFPEDMELKAEINNEKNARKEASEKLKNSGIAFDELVVMEIGLYHGDGSKADYKENEVRVELELKDFSSSDIQVGTQFMHRLTDGSCEPGIADVVWDERDLKTEFSMYEPSAYAITWQNTPSETEGAAVQETDDRKESQITHSEAEPAAAEDITVKLQDDIWQSGCLKSVVSGADASAVAYQWYESTDGSRWEIIPDTTTINSKEADYYVARNGARKFYKVQVTDAVGKTFESDKFQVLYYESLQNGGFEKPLTGGTVGTFANGTPELEWKTTAIDISGEYLIEFGHKNTCYRTYGIPAPAEGDQFVELNCSSPGALYQDVLTQPGATLYWSLNHAGRLGIDTMSVLISNVANIPDGWNPSGGNYGNLAGDVQAEISDGKGEWGYYTGSYTVPEGQYVTRFYFAAKSSAGSLGAGNLLDNIHFGKDVPEPPASKGNLTVHKEVEGIEMGNVPNRAFSFAVKDHAGNSVGNFSLPTATGEWEYTLTNLDPGEYTVSETVAELPGYILKSAEYSVNGGTKLQGDVALVNVQKKQASDISYTNTYEPAGRSLVIENKTAGNMGDTEKEFEFIWKINDGKEQSVKLKSGAEFSVPNVKKGDRVLVREITEEKYQAVLTVLVGTADHNTGDGAIYTSEIQEDTRILFTNTKNMSPPTGVPRNSSPYIIMIIAALGITGILNFRRKRGL